MMKIYTLLFAMSLYHIGAGQGRIEGHVIDRTTGRALVNTEISLWVIDSIRYDTLREKKPVSKKVFSFLFFQREFYRHHFG